MSCISIRPGGASSSARARRWRHAGCICATSTGWATGRSRRCPADGLDVFARVRSTRPPLPARLLHRDGHVSVDLADGEAGVAPGQACVLYERDGAGARVLGGGFIERSEHDREAERALRRIVGQEPAIAVAVRRS